MELKDKLGEPLYRRLMDGFVYPIFDSMNISKTPIDWGALQKTTDSNDGDRPN